MSVRLLHPRVRLLYLEFMYLLPQLNSFYTPRAATTATSTLTSASSSSTPSPALSRPFFLRIAHDHPAAALLRQARVVEFETHRFRQTKSAAAPHPHADESVVVFKLQTHDEMQLLDAYMPQNWRNSTQTANVSTSAAAPAAPTPESEFRAHVQRLFYANALLPVEGPEWKRCLARGRYELRGIQNVLHVRKYRALHKRYGWASQLSRPELEAVWAGDIGQVEQALLGLSNKDVYGYAEEEGKEEEGGERKEKERMGNADEAAAMQ